MRTLTSSSNNPKCRSAYLQTCSDLNINLAGFDIDSTPFMNTQRTFLKNKPQILISNKKQQRLSNDSQSSSLSISKSLNHLGYGPPQHKQPFPYFTSLSSLNKLTDLIDNCKYSKLLSNQILHDEPSGYLSKREEPQTQRDLNQIKKDYLFTELFNKAPLSSNNSANISTNYSTCNALNSISTPTNTSINIRSNSRLKDKINDIIEFSQTKHVTINLECDDHPIEKDVSKTTSTTSKKTLSEQRKDIIALLNDKPSSSYSKHSSSKTKFQSKALELEESPYLTLKNTQTCKVNTFQLNDVSLKKKDSNSLNNNTFMTKPETERGLDLSKSVQKITLMNKMLDMKLTNNHLYKKKQFVQNANDVKSLQRTNTANIKKGTSKLISTSNNNSNNNSNIYKKNNEQEYRIKNKINALKKFKFSHNYFERKKEREQEIKENNLQLITMINEKLNKNITREKEAENAKIEEESQQQQQQQQQQHNEENGIASSSSNAKGHHRISTFEEIDIDIDDEVGVSPENNN
jgi:hypothetical protein